MAGQINQQPLLAVESLESRWCLSTSPWVAGAPTLSADGILAIRGSHADNEILVSQDDQTVTVSVDGMASTFNSEKVQRLSIRGLAGDDYIANETKLDATIHGGRGNDVILGGAGNDVLRGGAGNDILTDTGGAQNVLVGGSGDDNLWALSLEGEDALNGGAGDDTLYSIVGGTNLSIGGTGADVIIARGTDNTVSDTDDVLVEFKDRGRDVALDDGVLYVMGGGRTMVMEVGDQIMVVQNGRVSQFKTAEVNFIAGIGDSEGADLFVNATSVQSVYYGAGGNDTLVGGSSRDILKGGAGNDMVLGMGGDDDLTGDDGADAIIGGTGNDILRIDATDRVFSGTNDQVIGNRLIQLQATLRRR